MSIQKGALTQYYIQDWLRKLHLLILINVVPKMFLVTFLVVSFKTASKKPSWRPLREMHGPRTDPGKIPDGSRIDSVWTQDGPRKDPGWTCFPSLLIFILPTSLYHVLFLYLNIFFEYFMVCRLKTLLNYCTAKQNTFISYNIW